jgi:glycosyltransferase involved in cell wall biosynthesis
VKVVHIQRRPLPAQFSVEGYFDRVRQCLSLTEEIRLYVVPCFSRGIFGRIRNCLGASRNQADVNHVTGDVHYVTCLLPRRRTILTILDCQVLTRLTGWRRSIVRLLWYTLPARQVTRITVISEETRCQLLREIRFPADRVHVIPVSVSEKFQPSVREFNETRPRVLQVGTKANKNVERLVQALSGLSCSLDIVGPVDDKLQQLLQQSGVPYRCFGRLTDAEIVELYVHADVIAFVSTYEGFGMPIVEAQCVERVCVTSSCSSMPEVAGAGACLVDPYDVDSIRAGFRRVFSDPDYRETLIQAGRVNRQRFNAQKIADDFLVLYRQVYAESQIRSGEHRLPNGKNSTPSP